MSQGLKQSTYYEYSIYSNWKQVSCAECLTPKDGESSGDTQKLEQMKETMVTDPSNWCCMIKFGQVWNDDYKIHDYLL